MDLKNVKAGMFVSIILTSGASINGVIGVKNNIELEDKTITVLRVVLSQNHTIDITEDEIYSIKYGDASNKDNKFHIICRDLEKYGIEEDMTPSELINFFIYTWNDNEYEDEEKKDICRNLIRVVDIEIMQELLDLIVESNDKLYKYHEKSKKQLKEEYNYLMYELDKNFDSWCDMPVLNVDKQEI